MQSTSRRKALSKCLEEIQVSMKGSNDMAGIWQDWSKIAGEPLASNCQPINLRYGILYIGSKHPQWRQALIYNRIRLLEIIRKTGYPIKEIRVQQYHPEPLIEIECEENIWARHPSRTDVHGLATCEKCGKPAPAGEMALWGSCSFCKRKNFK